MLLIVLAGAALVAVATDGTGGVAMSVTVFDRTLELSKLELFLAGAAAAAVFLIGLMVLTGGMRRSGVRRRRLREARAESARVSRLEEEKRRLEQKLEAESATPAPVAPVTVPAQAPAPESSPAGRHAHVDRDHDGVDDRDEIGAADRVGASTRPARAATDASEPYPTDRLVAGDRPRDAR
ncbi:hypothetical protein [Sphaerisporangium album]|nr:hypothetical protein [Sphaerisporangium album]